MATVAEEAKKSRRDSFRERMATKRPDLNLDDEEAFYGALDEDYNNFDAETERYNKNQEQILGLYNSDPRSADFINAWSDGKDPVVEFIKQYGSEIEEALNDPEKLEELENARAEYAERLKNSQELDSQFEENVPATIQGLQDAGYTDEEIDQAFDVIASIINDALVGKISPETVKLVLNGKNHDSNMVAAEEKGRVDGLNSKIKETTRKRSQGDGLPQGMSGGGDNLPQMPAEEPEKPNIGALGKFSGGSVWDNAKRTKRR